jgi:glycerophosphoryl diester phosphodiesterase
MQRKAEVVKLDIHFTKDGIPVLSHDSTLSRCLGWDVAIKDKTLQEIKQNGTFIPVGGYEGEKLQTLAEGLAITKNCPEFWIDTKTFPPNTFERILPEFEKLGISRDRIMVATGVVDSLKYAKEHFPELRRVRHIYPQHLPKEGVLEHLLKLKEELDLFGMNLPAKAFDTGLLTPDDLQKLRAAGLWCSIWFVQNVEAAKKYSEMGADAFVTDNIRDVRQFCRTPGYVHEVKLDDNQ